MSTKQKKRHIWVISEHVAYERGHLNVAAFTSAGKAEAFLARIYLARQQYEEELLDWCFCLTGDRDLSSLDERVETARLPRALSRAARAVNMLTPGHANPRDCWSPLRDRDFEIHSCLLSEGS